MRINKKILAGITAVSMLSCGIWMESVFAADVTEPVLEENQSSDEFTSENEQEDSEKEIASVDTVTEDKSSEQVMEEPDTSGSPEDAEEIEAPAQEDEDLDLTQEDQGENSFADEADLTEQPETENGLSGFCGAEENTVAWSLDENGVLAITGQGDMENWENAEAVPWNSYRDKITTVKIAEGVTSVGAYAFANCQNLTEIEIADSVQNIGAFAYFNCSGLSALIVG